MTGRRRAARTGTGLVAIIAIASVTTGAAAPAAAGGRTAAGLALLDGDAAIVISARPTKAGAAIAAIAGHAPTAAPVLAARAAVASLTTALNADPATPAAWRRAGFDAEAPIVASLAAIDPAGARAVFDALATASAWDDTSLRRIPKVYWRTRVVIPVVSRLRASRTVARVARRWSSMWRVNERHAGAVTMLLGGRGAGPRADAAVASLRKADVFAVGWIEPLQAFVAVRLPKRHAVLTVEIVAPFAGVPVIWRRDGRELVRLWTRRERARRPPSALGAGAAAVIRKADLGMWIQPRAALAAARAARLHLALRRAAPIAAPDARADALRRDARGIDACEALTPVALRGPVTDLAVAITARDDSLAITARWGLRRGHGLAGAGAPADDRLLVPIRALQPAASAVWRAPLAALAGLPTPTILERGTAAWRRAAGACGAGATVAGLVGWPLLAAAALADAGRRQPALAAVIETARNLALALPRAAQGHQPGLAAAVSIAAIDAEAVMSALDDDLGPRTTGADGAHHAWPVDGGVSAFAQPLSDAAVAVGRVAAADHRAWFDIGEGSGDGDGDGDGAKAESAVVAAFRLDLAAVAAAWSPERAASASGGVAGIVTGRARLGGAALTAVLELTRAPGDP